METINSSQVGGNVKDVQVGDHVGIGYFIDSCLACQYCKADEETLCEKGTYSKIFSLLYRQQVNDKFFAAYSKKVSLELLLESSNMVISKLTMAPIHMEVGLKRSLPTGTLYLLSPSPIPWKRLDLSSVLELQCSTH